MNIAIIGSGYVGLVSGACFSETGVNVTCVDIDQNKIDNLKKGIIPIFEPGLSEMIIKNQRSGRLDFISDVSEVLDKVSVVFIAVGTPSDSEGNADLSAVYDVAKTIGKSINNYTIIVTKSTVPVGTTYKIKEIILAEQQKRGVSVDFDVASNPEFLKEGDAIKDFMSPDRVVVGIETKRAEEIMTKLYRPFLINNFRVIFMDIFSSEMTKYAANAMLATRISFMNDIANLCDLTGANINMVRKGIGTDARIGNKFLYAGCGYGGSCFPKDVKALISTAKQYDYELQILQSVDKINKKQKTVLVDKLIRKLGNLEGKTIAVWGLTYKPNTDDLREAPALEIIRRLIDEKANVRLFDPIFHQVDDFKIAECYLPKEIQSNIYFANDAYDAALEADAILLVTEWKEFRMPNWSILNKTMKTRLIIDGRNIFEPREVKEYGFLYEGIGLK